MEITSFRVVKLHTHIGNEFFRENTQTDIQTKTCFRVEAEVRNADIDSGYADMPRSDYHATYGPLTLKQFMGRLKYLIDSFQITKKIMQNPRRTLRCVWLLEQIYEYMDGSMELLLVRMKQLLVNAYDQFVVFKRENIPSSNKLGKYIIRTLNIMEKVCGKISRFLASRPEFLFMLKDESKMYFFENATPCMVSKIGYLQKNRWVDDSMVPIVAPKYYLYWNAFWKDFLVRYLQLGDDICGRIAEFIPTRIEGTTFLDFFRKNFDLENKCFVNDKFTSTYSVSYDYGMCYNNITVFLMSL